MATSGDHELAVDSATAVQIAETVQGQRRIVAHLGSARTEAELGVLLMRARAPLTEDAQGELDLSVESTPGKRMSRVPWNFGGGPVSIRLR
jgi:hypothetical protein